MTEECKWKRWTEFGVRGEKDGCWIVGYFEFHNTYMCGKAYPMGMQVFRSGIVYRPDFYMLFDEFDESLDDARKES